MADPLQQETVGRAGELLEPGIASRAIGTAELDLDEFVVGEGALGLGDHRGSDAMLADEDHGIERVSQPPEVFSLPFGKFHGGIVKIAAARSSKCSDYRRVIV